ncbi:MAG TPA: DUF1549 domain-containing protein [Planctomycetota bacterium]
MVALLLLLAQIDASFPGTSRCSDEDFVRRIHLDLAGVIPTAEETLAFLAKPDRPALIEKLLASPAYARRMEEAFTVMLLERRTGEAVPEAKWRDWLAKKFADDVPWEATVRELLAADGRDASPAVKFFVDGRTEPHRLTQDVARIFLGKNLTCAQCHDHPHVKDWSQAEYMGLYAFLGQNKADKGRFMPQPMTKKVEYENVFRPEKKKSTGPSLAGQPELEVPAYAKGQEWEVPPGKDGTPGVPKFRPRERLAADLVAHPQFARTAVNRVWFMLMGRGFVHPIDMDHSKNPPSHPELLDALSRRFTSFKPLVREIVLSAAYQRADALLRPLTPEALARSVAVATSFKPGSQGKFNATSYLAGKKSEPPSTLDDLSDCFAAVFGAPAGEPETSFSVSTTQALYLRNDRLITELAAGMKGDVESLYLRILSRRPTDAERMAAKGVAPASLAWALLASAEFRLNH